MQSYIDFEIAEGERERTRELYERLLQRTRHVKVWMSYAAFEASPLPEPEGEEPAENGGRAGGPEEAPERREATARSVYERAYRNLRDSQPDAKEEAVMLLEAWRDFEMNTESRSPQEQQEGIEAVERKMPKRVKVRSPGLACVSKCSDSLAKVGRFGLVC